MTIAAEQQRTIKRFADTGGPPSAVRLKAALIGVWPYDLGRNRLCRSGPDRQKFCRMSRPTTQPVTKLRSATWASPREVAGPGLAMTIP
jgi:hypothetical protein